MSLQMFIVVVFVGFFSCRFTHGTSCFPPMRLTVHLTTSLTHRAVEHWCTKKERKESSNITHVQYISDTHAVSVCDFIQFHCCVSFCFQNICYALRFCLRIHGIQLMWAKWRMSFHVARKKRKNRTSRIFCHIAWPLWSERLSSTVCMVSFIWVVVFLCFTWHQWLIIVLFAVHI